MGKYAEVVGDFQVPVRRENDLRPLSRDYSVKLNQEEDVSVRFTVSTAKDGKNLAEVLHITVTDLTSGKTVCEGNLGDLAGKEFSESIAHAGQREKLLSYRITVTVDSLRRALR